MKALILAAGFGTRLLPYTSIRPKPLFTLNGIPVLQRCIEQLIQAGFTDIIINTHHLHRQIEQFIENYKAEDRFSEPVNITTIYEPLLLNTGGAIRNVRGFMKDAPFMVINSDIVSDIDLKMVWEFHLAGDWCVTLALHDYPIYNKVIVDNDLFVKNFSGSISQLESITESELSMNNHGQVLAFTGVQVISPEIFDHIYNSRKESATSPLSQTSSLFATAPFSSIALYSHLATQGNSVKAFICKDISWQDIGTYETYQDAAIQFAVADHLKTGNLSSISSIKKIEIQKLAGDGSDRGWFRCKMSDNPDISVIVADHGIDHQKYSNPHCTTGYMEINKFNYHAQEIDSFVNIGNHLFSKGIPVPQIKGYDRFSGLVVLEDLGDVHFQDIINEIYSRDDSLNASAISCEIDKFENQNIIVKYYKKICSLAIDFSMKGINGFSDAWTFQTASYSKDMIIEKECRYFVEAFLQNYLKLDVRFDDFTDEFEFIAENALYGAFEGLMHRDMQSRNIMVKGWENLSKNPNQLANQTYLKNEKFFFIDFQSARRGPFQYDLASLLIDPYVNLADEIKESILHECLNDIERILVKGSIKKVGSASYEHNPAKFIKCYRYCSLTRNMQMLGAFANLSMNKGKIFFQQYIPVAVRNLKNNINLVDTSKISRLYSCIINL